jgi:hypothetical protein
MYSIIAAGLQRLTYLSRTDGAPGVKVLWRGLQVVRNVLDTYRFLR